MAVQLERRFSWRFVQLAALCSLISLFSPILLYPHGMPKLQLQTESFSFKNYFRAMNGDVDLYSSTVYPDTPRVQRAIRKHQSPIDCTRVRFLVFELWNYGLGSTYLGASTALALAVASNRVLLLAEPHGKFGWMPSSGCQKRGPECFFQPVSTCTLQNIRAQHLIRRASNVSEGWISENDATDVIIIPAGDPHLKHVRKNLSSVLEMTHKRLGLSAPIAHELKDTPRGYEVVRRWHTQASLYLLRLNTRMQSAAVKGLTGCAGNVGADAFVRRTIGVPIRGSDKCKPARGGEMRCVDAKAVVAGVTRVRVGQPWITATLVTSEESGLARSVGNMLRKTSTVLTNENDLQQGSGSAWVLVNGKEPAFLVTESMLVTLTCQIIPTYHVLTMRSNYHSLIDMLAKVVPGKREHFSYSLGDLHYPV